MRADTVKINRNLLTCHILQLGIMRKELSARTFDSKTDECVESAYISRMETKPNGRYKLAKVIRLDRTLKGLIVASGSKYTSIMMDPPTWAKVQLAAATASPPAWSPLISDRLVDVGKIVVREEERKAQAARDGEPITAEKFYAARAEAQWVGMLQGWDAQRSYSKALLKAISSPEFRQRIAGVESSGGSGKSVSLRRLAVDLLKLRVPVWWVEAEDHQWLLEDGLSRLREASASRHYLLVDEAEKLSDSDFDRISKSIRKNSRLAVVFSGRRIPNPARSYLKIGVNLFRPDDAADAAGILQHIANVLPQWKGAIQGLLDKEPDRVRLVYLLTVLARKGTVPDDADELERHFVEAIADDVRRIGESYPTVAKAIIELAAIADAGGRVCPETFVALAAHDPGNELLRKLLLEFRDNPRWKMLEPLLDWETQPGVVRFHHDEYARVILKAAKDGAFGGALVGDRAWYRILLETVISCGSSYSASYTLAAFARQPFLDLNVADVKQYVWRLLDAGNGHQAYLRLLIDGSLSLNSEELPAALEKVVQVAPGNCRFWNYWFKKHGKLGTVRQAARRLLKSREVSPIVLCGCLRLLGSDPAAQEAARALLESSETRPYVPQVLCCCFHVLPKDKATKDAARRFVESDECHPELLCRCLRVLRGDPVAAKAAVRLLETKTTPRYLLCVCFAVLETAIGMGHVSQADQTVVVKAAKRHLSRATTSPDLRCSCLGALGDAALPYALKMLRQWNKVKDDRVLLKCIKIARTSDEACAVADHFLEDWENCNDLDYNVALGAGRLTPSRRQRSLEILENRQSSSRALVYAALWALATDPCAAKKYCEQILSRWHPEILFRKRRHRGMKADFRSDIVRALGHPELRDESEQFARAMLVEESKNPGFLGFYLERAARSIVENKIWPEWNPPSPKPKERKSD